MSCIVFNARDARDDEPLDNVGNTDNLKTHYALGTLRLEIEGKRFAIGRFLTWLYTDYSTDPVKRMMKCSSAIVIHQDPFLVDETLQAISKMFEQAVLWNAETDSKQDLKNRVALFRFTYAYCMPSSRGDGAIGDWFEMALYRLHGFANTRYNPDRLPCFEPLVSISLSRYLEHYDQTITVE